MLALLTPHTQSLAEPVSSESDPTLVLWNPSSGRATEAAEIRQRLAALPGIRVVETQNSSHAADLARAAVGQGISHVIAAGGDGTVNAVINGLMANPDRPTFAVLPIGTANDFAQTLAIPDELDVACDVALQGPRRPVDVVEYEAGEQHRWFANVAAGGNSDEVTRQLTDEVKQRWGPLCYLRGALDVITDLKAFEATVTIDDNPAETLSVWNVIVANGRTNAGHLQLAPQANIEDGLLDLILIRDGTLLDVPALIAQYALSDYMNSDLVIYRQARSVRFNSQPMMRFSIDGEAINEQPVVFRTIPAAMSMAVGQAYVIEPQFD